MAAQTQDTEVKIQKMLAESRNWRNPATRGQPRNLTTLKEDATTLTLTLISYVNWMNCSTHYKRRLNLIKDPDTIYRDPIC